MTQEEKDILLKDLCARLPYGVIVDIKYNKEHGSSNRLRICSEGSLTLNTDLIGLCIEKEIQLKPYLRPISSMTEKEKEELKREFCADIREEDNGRHTETYGYITIYHNFNGETWYIPFEAIDWLNSHHLDYRGLIPMGLAIEAPKNMYKL